jgi:hypothetical protein
MLKEFKEFAMRGNVMDMAIGIVIGAAFGKIFGGCEGSRRGDLEYWTIHQHAHRLPDHRVCYLPGREGNESPKAARGGEAST